MNPASRIAVRLGATLLAACPLLALEPAAFTAVTPRPPAEIALDLEAPEGSFWRVETSEDLAGWDGWRTFESDGQNRLTDSDAARRTARFFRAVAVDAAGALTGDHLSTDRGDAIIHPIDHASLVIGWNGRTIYIDPVGGAAPYAGLPRADLILITHHHGDHLHAATLDAVRGPATAIVAPQTVYNALGAALKALTVALPNGASTNLLDATVEAVPAYNLTTSNHPKGVGNGYILTLGGQRVYFSGDTEDIPEMRALRNIDVAFLCMNVPFTMTVAKAASAVREFRPRVVYPYHYRNQDGTFANLTAFRQQVGADAGVEVRLRDWY